MARLDIDHLSIAYGAATVVRDLSLTVQDGECLSLLGPSGCGKTTTLRAVAGFAKPSSGRIRIGGRDVGNCPPHSRNVGLVFQDYALFPHMTVAENVAYGLKRRNTSAADITVRVREALRMVRLDHLEGRYPGAMSGGQRQRVALARALVIRPDVLLLDEPLGALDRKLRDEMQDELKTLQAELGFTCIIVTHDQEEALSLSSRVALMLDGDIAEIGAPAQLYAKPGSVRAMSFLGASSFMQAEVCPGEAAETYRLANGVLIQGPRTEASVGSRVTLGVRPERIQLTLSQTDGLNAIPGRIRQVVYKGPTADIYVESDDMELRAQVTTGDAPYVSGQMVWAKVSPHDFLVFTA